MIAELMFFYSATVTPLPTNSATVTPLPVNSATVTPLMFLFSSVFIF
jgi:hypothetical protein